MENTLTITHPTAVETVRGHFNRALGFFTLSGLHYGDCETWQDVENRARRISSDWHATIVIKSDY